MLNIATIRADPDAAREALRRRGAAPDAVDRLLELDEQRRRAQTTADALKAEKNRLGPEIAKRKKTGEDASDLLAHTKAIADETKALDHILAEAANAQEELLLVLPNLALPDVPVGVDATANVEVKRVGEPRAFDFPARTHDVIAESLGLVDMARGAKLTGSGWPLYVGWGARLEWALISLFLDVQTREHGYTHVQAPFVANRQTMVGTGQLPKFETDMYRIAEDDLFLIPTSEVTLANLYRDEILAANELPKRVTGYSPCFRREAGSHGKDTRGIQRVHQFNKVELVKVTTEDTSAAEHESMRRDAEVVLERLGLVYRVLLLSTGDMGFGSAKTWDLEVWAPASDRWFECSSVSNCLDFQARRMNLRYRGDDKKLRHCHTLNGSGLATPRVYIALLETYQRQDGGLDVPTVLRPYLGVDAIPPRGRA